MNKLDDAWAILRKLPMQEQERAAEAIFDYAARTTDFGLTEEQVTEIEQRLADRDAKTVSMAAARARMEKLYS